jgi:hypothetical protein
MNDGEACRIDSHNLFNIIQESASRILRISKHLVQEPD